MGVLGLLSRISLLAVAALLERISRRQTAEACLAGCDEGPLLSGHSSPTNGTNSPFCPIYVVALAFVWALVSAVTTLLLLANGKSHDGLEQLICLAGSVLMCLQSLRAFRAARPASLAMPAWLTVALMCEVLLLASVPEMSSSGWMVLRSCQVAALLLFTTAAACQPTARKPIFDPRRPETFMAPRMSPMDAGSFFAVCSFSWTAPLLKAGLQGMLHRDQVYDVSVEDDVRTTVAELAPVWAEKLAKGSRRGNLVRALYQVWWKQFWISGFYHGVEMALMFVQPAMLNSLIKYYNNPDAPLREGILYTLGLLFGMMASRVFDLHFNFNMSRLGIRAQGATSGMVFEKALRLTQPSAMHHTPGQIASVMNVDCERLSYAAYFVHFMWSMPLVFLAAMWFIWQQLGLASLAAVVVMVGLAPLNKKIAKMFMRISLKISKERDIRVATFTEINSAVKFVKLLTWESKIYDLVEDTREKELKQIRGMKNVGILARLLFVVVPLLLPLLGFGAFYALSLLNGKTLDAATAFTSLAIFDVLYIPINLVPITAQFVAQMYVSLCRIEDLLSADERKEVAANGGESMTEAAPGYAKVTHADGSQLGKLSLKDVAVRWKPPMDRQESAAEENNEPTIIGLTRQRLRQWRQERQRQGELQRQVSNGSRRSADEPVVDEAPPTLTVDSLEIPAGLLTMVVGKVGAGKSTLLATLLNEAPLLQGTVRVYGTTAFCTQQAWIMHGTVRANIVFNRPMDMARYKQVLQACALDKDVASWDKKDLTVVGERGISLSGGQKARIALARAAYSGKDIILLDDVLSAVDAHVGAHVMRRVLKGGPGAPGALEGKTRVLVTHQTQWLPCADYVVVVRDGKIAGTGTYEEVLARGLVDAEGTGSSDSLARQTSNPDDGETALVLDEDTDGDADLDGNEDRREGSVAFSIWKTYAVALGVMTSTVAILSFALAEGTNVGANWVLARWTAGANSGAAANTMLFTPFQSDPFGVSIGEWAVNRGIPGSTSLQSVTARRLWEGVFGDATSGESSSMDPWPLLIYSGLLLLSAGCIMSRSFFMRNASINASRQLHRRALMSLLRAPMSWHDTVPNGQKINRFTADLQQVDEDLQGSSEDVVRSLFALIGCLLIVILVSPVICFFLPFLAFFYYVLQRLYRSSARDIQRLESMSRSPVSQLLDECINGKSTISGMAEEANFCKEIYKRINRHSSCFIVKQAAERWLALRLRVLGCCVVGVVSVYALMVHKPMSEAEVSRTALAMKYAIQLTDVLNSIVQGFIIVELALISLERVDSFGKLPSEAPLQIEGSAAWDETLQGELVFDSVAMRYRPELSPVLKDCSFRVPGGSSVGVVGRTGAGKSSLLEAVFRLRELEGGMIRIEGVDISKMGLHQLRSRLAIIPQDPVLFACPLRTNLDPFREHSDEAIKEQLLRMELKEMLDHPDGLMRTIAADGGNLSVGQRQLVCLARALLRQARVFFLDEATASIDKRTDELIQKTLRTDAEARVVTLVTIAHRLETVLNGDLILVMEDGKVAEFGPTSELRARAGGKFAALLQRSHITAAAP